MNIDTSEDSSIITAIKTKEQLGEFAVKDEIREITLDTHRKYNAKVTQSSYADNSSLGDWYMQWNTKGEAISRLKQDGYTICADGKELSL